MDFYLHTTLIFLSIDLDHVTPLLLQLAKNKQTPTRKQTLTPQLAEKDAVIYELI